MRAVWTGALVLFVAVLCAVLIAVPQEPPPDPADASIVFVGSSLIQHAIPQQASAEGLFGDGRRHSRLTRSSITERQTTELIRAAITAGVRDVFVEIYPYVRTFNYRRGEDITSWTAGVSALWEDRLRNFGRRLRGLKALAMGEEPWGVNRNLSGMDLSYNGDQKDFKQLYPMQIHPPRAPQALETVLSEARARGVRVVFIAPPRSRTVVDYLGAAVSEELIATIATFEHRFDVEVWNPALSWPDDQFKDGAHVNARGRARFIEALRARFRGPDERS